MTIRATQKNRMSWPVSSSAPARNEPGEGTGLLQHSFCQ
jgi:hypothetical protein